MPTLPLADYVLEALATRNMTDHRHVLYAAQLANKHVHVTVLTLESPLVRSQAHAWYPPNKTLCDEKQVCIIRMSAVVKQCHINRVVFAAAYVSHTGFPLHSPISPHPPTSSGLCCWVASCLCVVTTETLPHLMQPLRLAGGQRRRCSQVPQQQAVAAVQRGRLLAARQRRPSVRLYEALAGIAGAGCVECA